MMIRHLVALAALGLLFAALACSGGAQHGSVTYAPTVVPIKHIDFTDVELSESMFIHPPQSMFDQFPEVVATVNGKPVTNSSVVYAEIGAEANRQNEAAFRKVVHYLPTLRATPEKDSLEAAIDAEIEQQAIARLKLLPAREEGVIAAQTAEASFNDFLATASPEARSTAIASNRLSGVPDKDWASNDRLVEEYRNIGARLRLEREYCPIPTIGLDYTPPKTPPPYRDRCADFLARERKNAKIVYYVRWAD
jgi:hypothetical protein